MATTGSTFPHRLVEVSVPGPAGGAAGSVGAVPVAQSSARQGQRSARLRVQPPPQARRVWACPGSGVTR